MWISKEVVFGVLILGSFLLFQSQALLRQCYGLKDLELCEDELTPEGAFCGWQWAFSIIGDEEKVYTILANPDLYSRFSNRYAKESGSASLDIFIDKGLSQAEANWVLDEAGVSLGDAYILYVPESNRKYKCHVVSVTVGRSGTGVPLELFYLALRSDAPLPGRVGRPIGIIRAEELGIPPKPDLSLIGPKDHRYLSALAFVKEMTEKVEGQVELDDYAFLFDGVNPAIFYKRKTEGLISLGCLVSDNGIWKPSAFHGDFRIVNGLLPIEEENVEHDLGMYETIYTVLNDINGNGFVEIYIKSTVSYLLELDSDARVNYRIGYYNGP